MITLHAIQQQAAHSGSTAILAHLFGNWIYGIVGQAPSNATPTLLTAFAAIISAGAVTLFGVLITYVGIFGLTKTATEGTFLGKEWSGPAIIGRSLAGALFIAPIPGAHGLGVGQGAVIAAALVSSGFADLVSYQTLKTAGTLRIYKDAALQPPAIPVSQTQRFIDNTFFDGLCDSQEARYTDLGGQLRASPSSRQFQHALGQIEAVCTDSPANTSMPPFLSEKQIQKMAPSSRKVLGKKNGVWSFVSHFSHGDQIKRQQYDIQKAAMKVTRTYYNKALALSGEYAQCLSRMNGNQRAVYFQQRLPNLADEYHAALQAAIAHSLRQDYQGSVDGFTKATKKFGWMMFGSYYHQLAAQQAAVQDAVNSSLADSNDAIQPAKLRKTIASDDMIDYRMKQAEDGIHRQQKTWWHEAGDWVGHKVHGALSDVENTFAAGTKAVTPQANALGVNLLHSGIGSDPITTMSHVGHILSATAQWGAVGNGALHLIGVHTGAGDLLLLLFVGGAILGSVLPAIPWIYFMMAVISWLTYVAEWYLVAPFWFAAHAAPTGRAHTSDLAAKGYNNMMFIVAFPTFAIGGFIMALSISWIGMFLVNTSIGAMFSQELGGVGGFFAHGAGTVAAFVLLYVGLSWIVLNASFNLTSAFARNALGWISVGEPGQNQFEQHAERVRDAVIGVVSRPLGGARRAGAGQRFAGRR